MAEHFLPLIEGYMPLQLLVELGCLLLLMGGLATLLGRAGWSVGLFVKSVVIFLVIFVWLKYRVYPPMPFSVLITYLVVSLAAILLWASSSEEYWQEFRRPIIALLDAETLSSKITRTAVLVLLPCLAGLMAWNSMTAIKEEPIELRTVGPAPPSSFKLHGQEVILQTTRNPYRVNKQGVYDPYYSTRKMYDERTGSSWYVGDHVDVWHSEGDRYLTAAKEGGYIYFQECVFCHGANLSGRGIFQFSLNPYAPNFTDPGTIAQLQEVYAFWRTASGGINIPNEGFPWASTEPRMEEHLSTDEIWKVILFIYWHTGWVPRTWD